MTRNHSLQKAGRMSGNTEYGSIEREIQIDASPEVVFQVISSPEHLKEWWPDEAALDPDGAYEIVFGDRASDEVHVEHLTVVDARPPRHFSFRWVYGDAAVPDPTNSLLVTFDLIPVGDGTVVRMTETGFRERGWEGAVLEEAYNDHSSGWDHFIPRLGEYVTRLAAGR